MTDKIKDNTLMETNIKENIEKIISDHDKRIYNMMNPKLSHCDFEKKSLTLEYEVMDWELNPNGIMHGGLLTTSFDNGFGSLARFLSGTPYVATVNIGVNFLKPVPVGETLVITVYANSVGRTIISMGGTAHLKEDNLLVATSDSTFIILDKKPTPHNQSFFKK